MAAGRDRYESLRKSEDKARDHKETVQPQRPQEAPSPRSPGWTLDQSLEAQQKSARKYHEWAKATRQYKHAEAQKAKQGPQTEQQSETLETSSSKKQKPVRTYEDLKAAHAEALKSKESKENKEQDKEKAKPVEVAKPKLKFFEDINKVERDRER